MRKTLLIVLIFDFLVIQILNAFKTERDFTTVIESLKSQIQMDKCDIKSTRDLEYLLTSALRTYNKLSITDLFQKTDLFIRLECVSKYANEDYYYYRLGYFERRVLIIVYDDADRVISVHEEWGGISF